MTLFDATRWIGGVAGFAGTGYTVQLLGIETALMTSALLPLLALLLLVSSQWAQVKALLVGAMQS